VGCCCVGSVAQGHAPIHLLAGIMFHCIGVNGSGGLCVCVGGGELRRCVGLCDSYDTQDNLSRVPPISTPIPTKPTPTHVPPPLHPTSFAATRPVLHPDWQCTPCANVHEGSRGQDRRRHPVTCLATACPSAGWTVFPPNPIPRSVVSRPLQPPLRCELRCVFARVPPYTLLCVDVYAGPCLPGSALRRPCWTPHHGVHWVDKGSP
jgi:hypothetical protein